MIIKNVILCDASGERKCDIEIVDDVIKNISLDIASDEFIDGSGRYLLPALVDLNVNTLDANLNAKNIKTLAQEALRGGIGRVMLNPTSTPPLDNEIVLEFAQNALHNLDGARVDLMINALKEDHTLSNISILLKRGAMVPYISTITKNDQAIKIAQYSLMHNKTLFCKAEDNSLISSGVMLEGDISSKLGLAGIPDLSEVLHVSRMIEIAREFNISILFKSIASAKSISLIDKAKKEGLKVSCEVSIHHLLNSDEACLGFNTNAKLNPPLTSKKDLPKLMEALRDGKIDILTTLHQPSSPINKEVAFYDASYGCEGFDNALSLYYTKLVKPKHITMSRLVEMCVDNPLRAIGESANIFKIGSSFKTTLFDPNVSFIMKNSNSLYDGELLYGKIEDIYDKISQK